MGKESSELAVQGLMRTHTPLRTQTSTQTEQGHGGSASSEVDSEVRCCSLVVDVWCAFTAFLIGLESGAELTMSPLCCWLAALPDSPDTTRTQILITSCPVPAPAAGVPHGHLCHSVMMQNTRLTSNRHAPHSLGEGKAKRPSQQRLMELRTRRRRWSGQAARSARLSLKPTAMALASNNRRPAATSASATAPKDRRSAAMRTYFYLYEVCCYWSWRELAVVRNRFVLVSICSLVFRCLL